MHRGTSSPAPSSAPILRVIAASAICVLIVGTIMYGIYHKSHADAALLYPSACLGGWSHPEHAAGTPDVQSSGDINGFTDDNSAVLPANTSADIFCGSFTGTTPGTSVPKSIQLSFTWTDVRPTIQQSAAGGEASDTSASDQEAGTAAALTGSATDTTASDTTDTSDAPPATASDTTDTAAPATDASSPTDDSTPAPSDDAPSSSDTPAPADDSTPAPSSAESFMDLFIPKAYAAGTDGSTSSDPVSSDASDTPTAAPDATADASDTATDVGTDGQALPGFLEVEYTYDGTTWQSLGTLDPAHLQFASFSIPVQDGMTWEDIEHLQIGIKSTYTIDPTPEVYLDSMALAVNYDTPDPATLPTSGLMMAHAVSQTDNLNLQIRSDDHESELVISTPSGPLGGLAVYDADSGDLKLTTYVSDSKFVLQPEYFGVGSYAIILTNDPNDCSDKDLEGCEKSSDFVAQGTFEVASATSTPPLASSTASTTP